MPDAGRWQRVKDVFQAALDHPPAERAPFLDETCGDDTELRREVESLLEAREEAPAFLSKPAVSIPAAPEAEGRRIGAYRLLSRIGYGGMGVVYEAVRDDDVFRKTVALKIVHGDATPEHLRRLARERQILAQLQHPNIASVIDGGTTGEGQPYLVMEYVEGEPIDRYCDRKGLRTRSRLEMFRTICAAVHYAHRNLVVHRDIKPANILVTADGQPKLLDFGIAKLLAAGMDPEQMPTATLMPVMTPEYASPEQVRGRPVTTATDVYSLGVLLYELLTGRRPFMVRGDSLEEIVRVVCATEPIAPSAVRRGTELATTRPWVSPRELEGDLDTIVLKALRKEPERRYLSAQELAEEVRRHLEGLPVLARGDTVGYRLSKFVSRHRLAVSAAALLAVSLVGGMALTLRQARIAEANRLRAERRFADVRKLANAFLFDFHDAIADLPGSTRARQLVVEHALEYLASLAGEAGGDRALQAELADAYDKVGDVQGLPYAASLGDSAGALESFARARAIRRGLLADRPDPTIEVAACRTGIRLGQTHLSRGEVAAAREAFDEARSLCESAWRARSDADAAEESLRSRIGLSDSLRRAGDLGAAVEGYRGILTFAAAVPQPGLRIRRIVAATHDRLGQTLDQMGDRSGALKSRRAFVDAADAVVRQEPTLPRNRRTAAVARENLASALGEAGLAHEGLSEIRKALEMYRALQAADLADSQAAVDVASAEVVEGQLLLAAGKPEAAAAALGDASRLAEGALARDPESLQARALAAASLEGQARVRRDRSDLAAARALLLRAKDHREAILARDERFPENGTLLAAVYEQLGAIAANADGAAACGDGRAWSEGALRLLRRTDISGTVDAHRIEALERAVARCASPVGR
jgi:eukaryotic-like serine/threonine-protein kinase